MTTVPALVYDGFLQADGIIQLDCTPEIRPGRVQVALRPLSKSATSDPLLPDGPWEDESISAPCDLPIAAPRKPIRPQPGQVRLPDPLPSPDEELA